MKYDGEPSFKIKLSSGRTLGPLNVDRVRLFIDKGVVTGNEEVRKLPSEEWRAFSEFPELTELLGAIPPPEAQEEPSKTEYFPTEVVVDKIEIRQPTEEDNESTRIDTRPEAQRELAVHEEEIQSKYRDLSSERTIVFQRPSLSESDSSSGGGERSKTSPLRKLAKATLLALVLGYFAYETFLSPTEKPIEKKWPPVRPDLPAFVQGQVDPQKSEKLYQAGIKEYIQDTVLGYRQAAEKFRASAGSDPGNVKALALLASSYINLIDSSNKDENYFSVISKLIEMSRAKAVDLPESVIADVEFYLMVNKVEAAQNRIVEYTKTHPSFGLEMFYYVALVFYSRGDAAGAAKYIGQIPDEKVFSAKVFYLRGQIAEKLNDMTAALMEYQKAAKFNNRHARSFLRISELAHHQGKLKEVAKNLDFLVGNSQLLSPKDRASAYYLHGVLSELFEKWDLALYDVERAVKLDKENHDYLLELYTLRAKAGEKGKTIQREARMYFFLGEGEKLLKEGKHHEALSTFLQARQANDESAIPLVKIGDMFQYLHDFDNARMNYKLAADRAPKNIEVWSKYISILIQSYEWEEAQKAMDKFRSLPVNQSAIDKAAADLYAKQGRQVEAQMFYKKAMGRDSVDPDVYIAYAKSLIAIKNFKDAPFFFALALRFDPLNNDALIGIAKCVAATESVERAISLLQEELQRRSGAKAEILSAIAELHIQKGDWEQAQRFVEQAMTANPEYGYAWKLQAQIYLSKEGLEKDALTRALSAYQSFSERNASDPSGYLEKYRIYVKRTEYEKASDELSKIFGIYPKYPNLHYYKGALYAVMGNHRLAADEFKTELANNPNNAQAMISYGKALIEVGSPSDALTQFLKAMQAAPQSADAKQEAGYANYLLKNYAGAIALFQAALALDKGNPAVYKRLGMAHRESGDTASAAVAFRKYLDMEPDAPDKAEFQRYLR